MRNANALLVVIVIFAVAILLPPCPSSASSPPPKTKTTTARASDEGRRRRPVAAFAVARDDRAHRETPASVVLRPRPSCVVVENASLKCEFRIPPRPPPPCRCLGGRPSEAMHFDVVRRAINGLRHILCVSRFPDRSLFRRLSFPSPPSIPHACIGKDPVTLMNVSFLVSSLSFTRKYRLRVHPCAFLTRITSRNYSRAYLSANTPSAT